MKTKFSALLDVRHKALQNQERKIMQHNALIIQKQEEIAVFMQNISDISFPKNGEFSLYLVAQRTKDTLLRHIDTLHSELSALKAHKKALQEEYKILNIEYEKIKYLDTKEQKSKFLAIKRQQSKEMDEISVLLHKREMI